MLTSMFVAGRKVDSKILLLHPCVAPATTWLGSSPPVTCRPCGLSRSAARAHAQNARMCVPEHATLTSVRGLFAAAAAVFGRCARHHFLQHRMSPPALFAMRVRQTHTRSRLGVVGRDG
eukprot:810325-Rhodomonas_salina.3